MTYFLIYFAAALLVTLSFVIFRLRKIDKEQQRSKARKSVLPSTTVTTISTDRQSIRPIKAAVEKTISPHQLSTGLIFKILVVDDQLAIRLMLAELFTTQGIEVFEAENGSTALDIFEKNKPNCVLLDLKLPETDGIEILRRIRMLSSEVPVILITAYADSETMEEAVSLGISHCFMKPFDIIELKEVVYGLMEKRSSYTEESK